MAVILSVTDMRDALEHIDPAASKAFVEAINATMRLGATIIAGSAGIKHNDPTFDLDAPYVGFSPGARDVPEFILAFDPESDDATAS